MTTGATGWRRSGWDCVADMGGLAARCLRRSSSAMVMSRDLMTERLAAVGYVADSELPVALQLMEMLGRPLLLEGEAGVGKTEVAKALAAVHGTALIRLQCYEGLDQSTPLY